MARVKRGMMHVKRRKNILKSAKGYRWGGKNLISHAKMRVIKAGVHAYRSRRLKKREKRALWNIQINAAVRSHDLNYSRFMHLLKEKEVGMDRKVLADIAEFHPQIFEQIVKTVK